MKEPERINKKDPHTKEIACALDTLSGMPNRDRPADDSEAARQREPDSPAETSSTSAAKRNLERDDFPYFLAVIVLLWTGFAWFILEFRDPTFKLFSSHPTLETFSYTLATVIGANWAAGVAILSAVVLLFIGKRRKAAYATAVAVSGYAILWVGLAAKPDYQLSSLLDGENSETQDRPRVSNLAVGSRSKADPLSSPQIEASPDAESGNLKESSTVLDGREVRRAEQVATLEDMFRDLETLGGWRDEELEERTTISTSPLREERETSATLSTFNKAHYANERWLARHYGIPLGELRRDYKRLQSAYSRGRVVFAAWNEPALFTE